MTTSTLPPSTTTRLARDLATTIRGEVRFDEASRHLYANDASIYRVVPIGVVVPRDAEDVVTTMALCREHGAPVLGRGCGTGLSGQSVNNGVVLDFSKYMNRIVDLDPEARTAVVQPGVICDQLRYAAMEHGLTFAPDPATHDHNTLGGMIGNNSCGTHSVYGGKTVDNVLELDVLLPDGTRLTVGCDEESRLDEIIGAGGRRGEIYRRLREIRDRYGDLVRDRFPDIPRRVSGYNLDDLLPEKGFNTARALVGTESTCCLVLQARVRLLPWPPKRSLLVLGYPDSPTAAEHVTDILDSKPLGLEFFESGIIDNLRTKGFEYAGMHQLPAGETFVLVEYGGDSQDEADARAEQMAARLRRLPQAPELKTYEDAQHESDVWEVRRGAIGSTRIPSSTAAWPAGRMPPSTRRCCPGTCGTTASWSSATATTPCSSATSARAASTTDSTSTSGPPAGSSTSAPSSTRPPTWSSATAVSRPASTATGSSRRPSSSASSAPSWCAPSRSSRRSSTPTG
jgi:FAD/FMN-containing dehydrogenase